MAIVNKNAEAHCVMDVAHAFVEFLHSKEAKEYYTTTGFLRSTDPRRPSRATPRTGSRRSRTSSRSRTSAAGTRWTTTLFGTDGIATQAKANAG